MVTVPSGLLPWASFKQLRSTATSSRRASCVLNGQTSFTRGRRQLTDWTGAENADCGTYRARQSQAGAVPHTGNLGLQTCQSRSPPAPGRLRTGGGRPLPRHLEAEICKERHRLELLLAQGRGSRARRLDRPDHLKNAERSDRSIWHGRNWAGIRSNSANQTPLVRTKPPRFRDRSALSLPQSQMVSRLNFDWSGELSMRPVLANANLFVTSTNLNQIYIFFLTS